MKHIITGLLTALVLAAPAQAQKPQPMKERGARYEVVKEWRKAFGQLKKEVEALKKEIAELKRNQRLRSRVRSSKPSIRSRRGRPDMRKSQGKGGMKKRPTPNKKR